MQLTQQLGKNNVLQSFLAVDTNRQH